MFFRVSLLFLVLLISPLQADDSQRVSDYRYDGAGNLIGVQVSRNLGLPTIVAMSPPFVNQGRSTIIIATGNNLALSDVSTEVPSLSISDIITLSDTAVQFIVSTEETASIGLAPLTFTTRFGSSTAPLIVATRTPIISTDPNPIILSPNGAPISVRLSFDQPFATEQTFDIAITDSNIAGLSTDILLLGVGETEVSTEISGLRVGSSSLEVNQLNNFLALKIPVIVNQARLPAGTYGFPTSQVLGIAAYIEGSFFGESTFSTPRPLGVSAYIEGSFFGESTFTTPRPLGVSAYIEGSFFGAGTFTTPRPLGVAVYIEGSFFGESTFTTPRPLGVVLERSTGDE